MPRLPDVASPLDVRPPPDLRMPMLAGAAWAGALTGFLLPVWANVVVFGGLSLALGLRHRRGRRTVVLAGCVLAGLAVAASAVLRSAAVEHSAVAALAEDRAVVTVTMRITSDPRLEEGRFAPYVLVRGRVSEVTGRGRTHPTGVPVLVIADPSWVRLELGSVVRPWGRLAPADGNDLAAVLTITGRPTVLRRPSAAHDAAAAVRAGIRGSVAHLAPAERSLIPALVVGDDQGMPPELEESFRTAGLTHLLAVSGTNLTLVVGFLLIVARWAGVRARGLVVIGVLGVVGFVLLARTEPSVVRAAAMGSVALIGMSSNGREKGTRALGVAVFALLLYDPWLATSVGFVLSALATAGILFLGPPWRDALMTWLPRWAAEAIAVPFAAQLACTPVVAAISGQVSLVAVAANMLVAGAVGPATVCGLAGGLAGLLVEPLGRLLGSAAGWCAWWIVEVAERASALPTAAVDWQASVGPVAGLAAGCLLLALVMPRVLRHRWRALGCAVVLAVVVSVPLPVPGWPPDGWVMVTCDVGQGDAVVLNAGDRTAVVVDAGPDPPPIDRCLDRLGVETVALIVLTHFHADHVGGLDGVLDDRSVGGIAVSALREPVTGADLVDDVARRAGVPVRVAEYGATRQVGDLTWQVVGPPALVDASGDDHGGGDGRSGGGALEGSAPNNASLVLLVHVRGVSILLTGDIEPAAQELIKRVLPDLDVDVLKVPHHGSRYQDAAFLSGLGARLAVISVGAGNDYGHPAPETVDLLRGAGMLVRRTDVGGDVAVIVRDGRLRVATRSGR